MYIYKTYVGFQIKWPKVIMNYAQTHWKQLLLKLLQRLKEEAPLHSTSMHQLFKSIQSNFIYSVCYNEYCLWGLYSLTSEQATVAGKTPL